MQTNLHLANQVLFTNTGMDYNKAYELLLRYSHKVSYGDIYFQANHNESWQLENDIIKESTFSNFLGAGVRMLAGEKTGFAYTNQLTEDSLLQALQISASIADNNSTSQAVDRKRIIKSHKIYETHDPICSITESEKIQLMQSMAQQAQQADSRIKHVNVNLSASHDVILIVASDGTLAADIRPLVRLGISIVADDGKQRHQAYAGGGGRFDYKYFLQDGIVATYVKRAVAEIALNFAAKDAPAGNMPVVLGAGWPAVMLHEAVGHGLEADFNRKGTSAFSNRLGEKVASQHCTVIDDGTLAHKRGSLSIDDEGTPSKRTVLIDKGILVNYMQDKLNARLMKMSLTGNGRRESYSHTVMPRMTNTYMLAGKSTPEEVISSVSNGLYASNFGGGQVNITNGQFVFCATSAYLIKNGKLSHPVKGVSLIGHGPTALQKVSMVANDFSLDSGVGICGKDGQCVPVGVGQATLLIDEMLVGGAKSS